MVKNLVVVRVGDDSVHTSWGVPRDWELYVTEYGTKTPSQARGKLEVIERLVAESPDLFEGREYIWFPDDDIEANGTVISRMFQTMREKKLRLAQPSLKADCYVNQLITMQRPKFRLRYTNFVEVMAPCMSADLFFEMVPQFAGLRFGWGMDFIWATAAGPDRTAILDECPVRHVRKPRTGLLYSSGEPGRELRTTMAKYGLKTLPKPAEHRGVLRDGTELSGAALANALAHDSAQLERLRVEYLLK